MHNKFEMQLFLQSSGNVKHVKNRRQPVRVTYHTNTTNQTNAKKIF